jgi:hypothetical protein
MKHEINKQVAVLLVALLPTLALADEAAVQPRAQPKPVVSVVALSSSEAEELAKARDAYVTQRAALRAEYEARVDALLAPKDSDKG